MAVRKPEPTDPIVDARMPADSPLSAAPASAAEQASREHGGLTAAHDPCKMIRGWNLRSLRAGAALLAGFEIIYFILDSYISSPLTPATMAPHAGAVGITLLLVALTTSKWFERHWRPVCFATLLAIYGLTLVLRLRTGGAEPLLITMVLTLIGTGALLPWSTGWQLPLSLAGLATMGVSALATVSFDSEVAYRWIGVLMAAALGHFILVMRERYQAELVTWMDSLRASRQDLADALAQSATIMAQREVAERRLREGEEMLRKVFDAAPDNIAITRMFDGAMLEVNREFLKTGYTREEVLGVSAIKVGRWSRPQLRALTRDLRTYGTVRNFETELRNKDGRLVPSLVSATMVELGGEQCVISIARDITELKRTQHELTEAREALAVELRKLEENRRQLVSSENKLFKVLEATGDIITISRLKDGHYLDVNQAFCDLTGYTRAEAIGRSAMEIGLWIYPDQLKHLLRLLKRDGRARNLQCSFHMKDGRVVEHLVSASLIKLDGETCIVAATRDVGELKRTERELRAAREALAAEVRELETSERRLRSEIAERTLAQERLAESEATLRKIFETSLDSISINRLSDGRFIAVNDEYLRLTGYSREEVLAATGAQLKAFSNRSRIREMLERLRIDGFARNFEINVRARDGRLIPHLFSATVVNVAGEPCVIAIVHDISPLKQTEDELRATQQKLSDQVRELEASKRRLTSSETKLRQVLEASGEAICVNRVSDGRYLDVNQGFCDVIGYTREEVLGRSPSEIGIWPYREQLREYLRRLKAGSTRDFECTFRMKDGRLADYLVSASVIELEGERCIVAASRNVSGLKQIEQQLIAAREAALAASEAKSHFLSVMSHEIRTPMNAILGMADLLWETPLSAEQRRYLDTMRNNSASLLNLVNGILDLSKVESGRLILEHADFDLVELAEDVMETLGVRAHEKGLELALRIPPALPTALTGDPLRLRQILINLLGNAIKFTERGEVTLTIDAADDAADDAARTGQTSTAPHGAEAAVSVDPGILGKRQLLRFVVRDTGIGIPADQQRTIFSNFIQADSTISRKYGGSGLGLAIVKRLVELMNGKITVESRPRAGSAFSFTIALELQPPSAAMARVPAPAAMARLAGKRVLVVDDSAASRTILAELLALTGAEVFVAADGAGALAELARARAAGRPYDAVVADNRMPAPNGTAIAQQIMSAAHAPREALVLMLTADDLSSQLGQLRKRGLEEAQRCRYLLKPVRRADLWAALAAACAGAPDERSCSNGVDAAAAAGHAAWPDTFIQQVAPRSAAMLVKKPLKILLAEDSPDNRLLVEAYLKGTPYQLDHAENGEIAVHKFMTGHYDAVLMDIQMPVMDGYEAAAEIRRLEQSDHRRPTPIIALTASAHDEAIRRSLQMGCDAHVTKPVKRSTLLEAIRDAVEPTSQAAPSAAQADSNDTGSAAGQPIVVQIDQDLSDLVPGFLTRKREDARAILAAVERSDPEAIARLGHKMKGEGGSYGLDAITDIGRELEQAGKDSDFDAARRLGRNLINFLERLEIVYRPMED